MDLEIQGNAALVTASSSGLGKASAKALAREGANVVVNGRDEDRLADAVEEVEAAATGGAEVVPQAGDIAVKEDVEALVETAVDAFGGLDHLVTSAGGPPPMRTLDSDDEDWYYAFDMLVMSVVRAVRASADHLQAGDGGSIVTVTSGTVKEATPTNVLSSSVRMGVMGLEKVLSHELAPEVRANAALPGAHETPRIEEMTKDRVERGEYASYEEGLADRAETIPLRRIGDPMEFGDAVAFLSSPRAGYINGTAVLIDGGRSNATL